MPSLTTLVTTLKHFASAESKWMFNDVSEKKSVCLKALCGFGSGGKLYLHAAPRFLFCICASQMDMQPSVTHGTHKVLASSSSLSAH